jgi:hypothetical protein
MKFGANHRIMVVCHDQVTHDNISRLELDNMIVIKLEVLELEYPLLAKAKENRIPIEYLYCLTPFVISLAQSFFPDEVIVYVDADIYFFSSPHRVLQLFSDRFDVAIVPHRFRAQDSYLEKYGKFNVGWLAFRNNKNAGVVLHWWRQSCLESTSLQSSEFVFGDQKYLDQFAHLFENVLVIEDLGHNLAPWNCNNVQFNSSGKIEYDGAEVMYFHFSGLRIFKGITRLGYAGYSWRPSRSMQNHIYKPYRNSIAYFESMSNIKKRSDFRSLSKKEWLRELYFLDLAWNLGILRFHKFRKNPRL